MAEKILKIKVSNTGKKVLTDGLSMSQNSSNNVIYLYSEGKVVGCDITFRYPDGKISDKYHATLVKWDEEYQAYLYTFTIPYALTSFTMPSPTARVEVSFTLYEYDDNEMLRVAAVANSFITVNRSNASSNLSDSYTDDDVKNLWLAVGKLTERINELEEKING